MRKWVSRMLRGLCRPWQPALLATVLAVALPTASACGGGRSDEAPGPDVGVHPQLLLRRSAWAEWQHARPVDGNMCLVTHYTDNMAGYARIAARSQQLYADRHGYAAKAFVGRLSGEQYLDSARGDEHDLFGGGLFWQKLVAIDAALADGIEGTDGVTQSCDWVLWLDSDIVITNYDVSLGHLIAAYSGEEKWPGHEIDVLLSQETDHPVSAGAFFVRNSARGKAFVAAVRALYPLFKDNNLPEQTAMATVAYLLEPWPSDQKASGLQPNLHPNIALAPQRAFNAFQGVGRTFEPEMQWQPGDFVAHFAGTPRHQREDALRALFDATCPQP